MTLESMLEQRESTLERLRAEKEAVVNAADDAGRKWAANASYRQIRRVCGLRSLFDPHWVDMEPGGYMKSLADAINGEHSDRGDVKNLVDILFDGEEPEAEEVRAFVEGVEAVYEEV